MDQQALNVADCDLSSFYICLNQRKFNSCFKMEKIEINGYKSIKQLSLQLRDINIFIGANGSIFTISKPRNDQ